MQAYKQPGLIMPAAFSTKELKEKPFYRYGFFDNDNQLQVLMPLTSGETIGLDNTCEAVLALKEYFGDFEVFSTEELLMVPIEGTGYNFKGLDDINLKDLYELSKIKLNVRCII